MTANTKSVTRKAPSSLEHTDAAVRFDFSGFEIIKEVFHAQRLSQPVSQTSKMKVEER